MPNTPTDILETELRRVLIRHLPVGFEGVGRAQATAVLALLQRRENHRPRAMLATQERDGLQILKQTATTHAASVTTDQDGLTVCGICHEPDGHPEPWPCPVWYSASLLRLTPVPPPATAI